MKKSINFIGYYSLLVVFDGVKEAEVDGKGGCASCIGSCPLCCSQEDEDVDELIVEVVVGGNDVGVWLFCLILSTVSFLTW